MKINRRKFFGALAATAAAPVVLSVPEVRAEIYAAPNDLVKTENLRRLSEIVSRVGANEKFEVWSDAGMIEWRPVTRNWSKRG